MTLPAERSESLGHDAQSPAHDERIVIASLKDEDVREPSSKANLQHLSSGKLGAATGWAMLGAVRATRTTMGGFVRRYAEHCRRPDRGGAAPSKEVLPLPVPSISADEYETSLQSCSLRRAEKTKRRLAVERRFAKDR